MVLNAELAANQPGDPLTRPQFGVETECHRALQHHVHQRAPLFHRKLGRTTRCGFGLQGSGTGLPMRSIPPAHRSTIHTESRRDFMRLKTPAQKLDGAQAPLFQLAWTSVWTHTLPPWQVGGSIGHYLRSCH
jgi:hypothetical protein